MQIDTKPAPKWQQTLFEKTGFHSERQLLDTFSKPGVPFNHLKKKQKGIFIGFVLSTPEGRDYFVKEISPVIPFCRDTQFIYHLGTRLGIKMPGFTYTKGEKHLFGVSAGLSRHEKEKTYKYSDYGDSVSCGCWSWLTGKNVFDDTSVPSIARLVLLSSLCDILDLHRHNIGVVKSRRDDASKPRKKKLAIVDFFATPRRQVTGLDAASLKEFLLSEFPSRLDFTAPELKRLLKTSSEEELRDAVVKLFTRFPQALKDATVEMGGTLGGPREEFIASLATNFSHLSAWYNNLPAPQDIPLPS